MNDRDHWKSTLLTVSDSAFFEIIRNYLGDLKTPFNKHDLIGRLESFLRDESVQARIVSLIDESEARVITAIAALEGPTVADMHKFGLAGETYADLHYTVLNLEDRLIVYEDEDGRVWITPHLIEALSDTVIHPGRLFPSTEVESSGQTLPWLSDVFLVALLSYLLQEPDLFRSDGELRKRAETELGERFPMVFGDAAGNRRWSIVASILENLGLAARSESKLLPQYNVWRELAELPRLSRLNLCWATAVQGLGWGGEHGAERLAGLIDALPADRALAADAVRRLISYTAAGDAAADEILEVLTDLGLLAEHGEGWFSRNVHLDAIFGSGREGEPACILQPNFELSIKPWVDLETGLPLAYIAEVIRFDTYPRFEISKSSVSRALAAGYEATIVAEHIRRLAGGSIPQNIAFSIDDWAQEYQSVQVYEGTVLAVDEQRRHFVEHSEEFRSFVHRTLAPGVYLVRDGFEEALQSAGIDVVPQVQRLGSTRRSTYRLPRGLRQFRPESLSVKIETSQPPAIGGGGDANELKERIEGSALDADLKDDLRQRLRRKLIVHPDQISTAGGRKEKSEARGLDYLGKVKLIQQTVSSKTHHLEVVARDRKGAPVRYLIRPEHVDKTGKELLLVGKTIPEGQEIQLAVSKLSLVRKLRGTFFER